jgi:hypothetical protein
MKAMYVRAFAFGSGLAVTVVLLAGAVIWYHGRPEPWNDRALKAVLSNIKKEQPTLLDQVAPRKTADNGNLDFTYVVENRTSKDYSTDGSSVVAMVRRPDGFAASEASIRVRYPTFSPSGQKVIITISIPYGDVLDPVESDVDVRRAIREKLPKLSGFVLFDRSSHYQIELPKGW